MTGRVKITPPKPEESWPDEHLEVHPAMELLLARMESNPEGFFTKSQSASVPVHFWAKIDNVKTHWNRKEKRLYNEALRKIRMEEFHQEVMKSILT
jgi:hypothetical protein